MQRHLNDSLFINTVGIHWQGHSLCTTLQSAVVLPVSQTVFINNLQKHTVNITDDNLSIWRESKRRLFSIILQLRAALYAISGLSRSLT